jgi:hypothetical protein
MRNHHAGKMRLWFDAGTQSRVLEIDDTDLANLPKTGRQGCPQGRPGAPSTPR